MCLGLGLDHKFELRCLTVYGAVYGVYVATVATEQEREDLKNGRTKRRSLCKLVFGNFVFTRSFHHFVLAAARRNFSDVSH